MCHGRPICNVCSRPLPDGRKGGYCRTCGKLRRRLARLHKPDEERAADLESRLARYVARAAAGRPLFSPLEVSDHA